MMRLWHATFCIHLINKHPLLKDVLFFPRPLSPSLSFLQISGVAGASQLFQTVQFEAWTLSRTTTSSLCALQARLSWFPSSLDLVILRA